MIVPPNVKIMNNTVHIALRIYEVYRLSRTLYNAVRGLVLNGEVGQPNRLHLNT